MDVPKLIGRDRELAALADHLDFSQTQSDQRVLALTGPAGVGKTLLMGEAQRRSEEQDILALRARGSYLEEAFSWGAVRQLFEPILFRSSSDQRARWLTGAANHSLIALGEDAPENMPASGDFAVLHGLYWLLLNISRDHPVCLFIDDLQWMDAPSLRFFAYLFPRLQETPVAAILTLRSHEEVERGQSIVGLINEALEHSYCRTIEIKEFSESLSRQYIQTALGVPGGIDESFSSACYRATGGNPLLLRELVQSIPDEGNFHERDAAQILRLASKRLSRQVRFRLDRLSPEAKAIADAASVLGEDCTITTAARLADLDTEKAAYAAEELQRSAILYINYEMADFTLRYVHPLLGEAIYGTIPRGEIISAHAKAAEIYAQRGGQLERAAAHLLRIPAAGETWHVSLLKEAAAAAAARASLDTSYLYLQRCLAEPLIRDDRVKVLVQAGVSAVLVDLAAAIEHLFEALSLSRDPLQRAEIAEPLSRALYATGRAPEGVELLLRVMQDLSLIKNAEDVRRRLQAELIFLTHAHPGFHNLATRQVQAAKKLLPMNSPGGWMLDRMLATTEAWQGKNLEEAVTYARRGIPLDNQLAEASSGEACAAGCLALLAADQSDHAMRIVDTSLGAASDSGFTSVVGIVRAIRSLGLLWQGDVADAANEARESARIFNMTNYYVGYVHAIAFYSSALIEEGQIEKAEEVLLLDEVPVGKAQYWLLDALSRVLHKQARYTEALDAAKQAGQVFGELGGENPSYVPWRSQMAISLHSLGRLDEARESASEELKISRLWGAPRALGRSLRIFGIVTNDFASLEESISVLKVSQARLEYAKSLAAAGSALRRANHRHAARPYLRESLDIATSCGAASLAEEARTELAASGARPRTTALTGVKALTPSEHRVAVLAAGGGGNRQIAQQLFVTPKTVEVHLSAAFRKLGISSRTELSRFF